MGGQERAQGLQGNNEGWLSSQGKQSCSGWKLPTPASGRLEPEALPWAALNKDDRTKLEAAGRGSGRWSGGSSGDAVPGDVGADGRTDTGSSAPCHGCGVIPNPLQSRSRQKWQRCRKRGGSASHCHISRASLEVARCPPCRGDVGQPMSSARTRKEGGSGHPPHAALRQPSCAALPSLCAVPGQHRCAQQEETPEHEGCRRHRALLKLATEEHPPGFWFSVSSLSFAKIASKMFSALFFPARWADGAVPHSVAVCGALEVGSAASMGQDRLWGGSCSGGTWGQQAQLGLQQQGLSLSFVFGPCAPGRAVLLQCREREGLASSMRCRGISLV